MTRGHPTGPGYLYAVFAGWWAISDDDGRLQMRVKLGSTRDPDPVFACAQRYNTFGGRPPVWWLAPSGDAYRDEIHRLHEAFKDRRIWDDRELFAFESREDFDAAIAAFTAQFEALTSDDTKPPAVTDLTVPLGLKRKARVALLSTRREERLELRQQHELQQHESVLELQQAQEDVIDSVIQECEKGRGLRVVAEEFNARAQARGAKRGIKNAMERRGFGRKSQKVGDRAAVHCYMGLGWADAS